MKLLGYRLTWPTNCFLGCGQPVWAHTEGNGDYVLFDSLGVPWGNRIHSCYLSRHDHTPASGIRPDPQLKRDLEDLLAALDDFRDPHVFRRPTHTTLADPMTWAGRPFLRNGQVEFYREKRLEHYTTGSTSAELREIDTVFRGRKSELGVVDGNGNLFVMFADLRDTVIAPGAIVEVEIGACRVPINRLGTIFLCHSLRVIQQQAREHSES